MRYSAKVKRLAIEERRGPPAHVQLLIEEERPGVGCHTFQTPGVWQQSDQGVQQLGTDTAAAPVRSHAQMMNEALRGVDRQHSNDPGSIPAPGTR